MGQKKQKPQNKLEKLKTVVEILAGITNIVFVLWQLFKG